MHSMPYVSHVLSSRVWWVLGSITVLLACGAEADETHTASATGGSGAAPVTGGGGGTIATGDTGSQGGSAGSSGASAGGSGPSVPVSCDGIEDAGFELCTATADTCTAVFTNGAGCTAVCAAAGL